MTEEPSFNDDFRDILVALLEAKVDFLIIGAHAMAVHGVPRATGDFDIFLRPSADNAARVMVALRSFGAPVEAHGVREEDFSQPGVVYQIGLPPRRIDLLTEISGVTFDEAIRERVYVDREGMHLPVIGRDALIENKKASGRAKDLVDVELLET